MTVEGKDYVKDINSVNDLQQSVDRNKVKNDFDFSAFNEKMEKHFDSFLKTHKSEFTGEAKSDTLKAAFNNWLDNELIKLDEYKNTDIEAIIGPTTFELQNFETATNLGIFQEEIYNRKEVVNEQIDGKNITINLYNKKGESSKIDKEDIVRIFNEKNLKNKKELLNLLNNSDPTSNEARENVRKFQRIIAGLKSDGSEDNSQKANQELGPRLVDGFFGGYTLEAFERYANASENLENPERQDLELENKTSDGEDRVQFRANVEGKAVPVQPKGNPQEKNTENTEKQTNEVYPDESDIEKLNDALSGVLGDDYNVELKITTGADGNKMDLFIPKDLCDKIVICYDDDLTGYIQTQSNYFKVPANIKVRLTPGEHRTLTLGSDGEKKLEKDSNFSDGEPGAYEVNTKREFQQQKVVNINNDGEFSVTSNESGLNGQHLSNGGDAGSETDEGEEEQNVPQDSRNQYHNLENNKYGEVPAEVVDSNYDALIDYMDGKENNNLIQAFKRLEINPNSIANTLAQVLAENPEVTKFERKHISSDAMKQLGRNQKLFVNEKNNIVKILNNVEKDRLQQFINEMKVFNDVRELQKTKKFVEMNKEKIKINPFLILSDFGKDGTVDTGEKGIKHHGRTSEQAMYDVFVSLADTYVLPEKRENGQSYKTIINGPKTQDLVKGFVSLMKTVGEDRYNDIESEFNGVYTMNKLGEYIVTHPETLVLYQQTINGLSYNSSMDIQDLVSDKRRKSIVDGEIQEIKEISTNRDEVNKRFESQLGKNEEFDKWFKALSAQEQKNFVGNMAVWLDEGGILPTIVKTFGINSKTGVTVHNLDAVDIDFNFFKDDAGIGPRIALIGPLQGGLGFHLDIPIANLTANFDLNHRAVENSVIHGANPVHQLYTRLGANVGGGIVVGGKTDEKLSAYFSAAIEGALGWKADYKKGIELNARNFGNVLQNGIFKDPNFSNKENFKKTATQSIDNILKGTDKENKNLRKFIKNNKQEMDNCVDNISNLLDVMGAFDSDKKPEHKKILLDSIMKGIVEEVKNQNLGELDGKTKLTRLGVFGQAGVGFDAKKLFQGDFKGAFGAGWSVGLEATLSAWNMVYLPDEEKYNYMDAQLKSGESIKPLGEGIKTNNIENMKNAITQSLSENSIPNIEVKSNDQNQIEISVTDAVLQKYGKKSIYELFNIYVNPDKKNNVAISEDGKTLTLGGNNLENFSVATRRYFDDFAVYLMIGGKGIDGCGNNKINDETVGEYNIAGHANTVPGFEFTERDTTSQTEQEKTESIGEIFESYNELNKIFTDIEKELSLMDNGNYGAYATFMNAAAELGANESLDTSDYDIAFGNLKELLEGKLSNNIFDGLKGKLDNATNEEKVMIVDRFKAIFSYNYQLVNEHNLGLQLNGRGDKYRNLYGYDKSADFPLSPNVDYRGKIQKQLNAKGTFTRKPNPNLIGMTAFYRLGDKNAGRSYMMTELGGTNVFGGETIEITDDLEATKKWFIANLDKSEAHKEILKASLREKIKSLFDFDVGTISDDNLKSLLMGEDIDIGNKKIKINVKYVFYLLGECANESIGVELGDITIKEKTNPDNPNPDNPNPDNPEDNVLEVGVDGQTLTKTESLNQNDVSAKVNIWGEKIEGSEDSGYGGQTNQEGTTGEGTGTGGGNTGQGGGVGGGSGSGGSNTGNGGSGRP